MKAARGEFWFALLAGAAPFLATPWLLLLYYLGAQDLDRQLGIFVLTSLIFIVWGLILLIFAVKYLRGNPEAREKRIGAGILSGMALGFIAGFASCFAAISA